MKCLVPTASLLAIAALAAGCAGTDAIDLAGQSSRQAQTPSAQAYSGQSSPSPGTTQDTRSSSGQSAASAGGQRAAPAQASPAVAALPANPRVEFAPVIGAAAEAVSPLAEQLFSRARQRGLTVTRKAEDANLVVKGYFSTISENGQTTVIYVWDVLDPAGNRLHRIQGQEKAPGGEEGWGSVTAATMRTIADRTVEELTNWLQAGRA